MPQPVALVQLHFRSGNRFTNLETPVTQFLLKINESFPNPKAVDDYFFAGPHLNNPEKAVVMICYNRARNEGAIRSSLHPASPIYAPITPYLRSEPLVDVFDFLRPPPTNYGGRRERVQELALIRIPTYQSSDEEDETWSNGRNNGDCIFVDYNNNDNDDDDDSSSSSSFSLEKQIYFESEDDFSPPSSPFAGPLAGLDSFFSSATCTNVHHGPADLATHYRGTSVATPTPTPTPTSASASASAFASIGDDDRPEMGGGAMLHAWSWVSEGAMRRFKDAERANCYDVWERRRLDDEASGEGKEEEGDDLWQTGFVREVEELRARGAEVEVMMVRLRRFCAMRRRLGYEDE